MPFLPNLSVRLSRTVLVVAEEVDGEEALIILELGREKERREAIRQRMKKLLTASTH
jgi:hypothetical protein